jgi:hypothetical protein
MIRQPTLFVLGAGASAEYDFPTGRSLLFRIVRGLRGLEGRLRYDMTLCGFSDALITRFANELDGSNQPSVDAFLELHTEDLDYAQLGKSAIAASLIADEATPALTDRSTVKVYEYIWHRASGTPDTYPGNALSFITFNYDRSLEQCLRNSLSSSHPAFRDRGVDFARALSQFQIHHVYGSLGSLDPKNDSYLKYGGFDHPESPDRIREAAARIKLYHEASQSTAVSPMRTQIADARTVCFLGFGFHPANLRLLQFFGLAASPETKFFASGSNMSPGDQAAAAENLNVSIEFANGKKCVDTLSSYSVLVRS